MTEYEQITALKKDVARMKLALSAILLCGAGVALVAATAPKEDVSFGTVTAERINIVEPDGLFRAVLTNGARSPGPMKEARIGAEEGHRNFPIGGLILYDAAGQEQGGVGTGGSSEQGSLAVNALDWPAGADGGFGEAIATYRRVDAEGVASSGIQFADRPAAGALPTDGVDRRRIKLQNVDRDAEVLLADAEGNDRIKLRVDAGGEASIEIVDREGNTVFRAPEN
ncbi:hypothetical protein [Pelagerythrobacter sp.]|uniref:hypothetical protein n=1 Tax=Pelagerythrobacter sp. TaxID=2800702 RepID=UPI0035B2B0E2